VARGRELFSALLRLQWGTTIVPLKIKVRARQAADQVRPYDEARPCRNRAHGIGWIDAARYRREVFEQRLRYFLKMTAQNKRFGMVQ